MPGRVPAMKPGDLNETFAIALRDFSHLEPFVLSSDPWIVVFDKFLSDEEVAALVLRGGNEGFSQSVDAGERMPDGERKEIEKERAVQDIFFHNPSHPTPPAHILPQILEPT
jgi:hypothetical protein